MQKVISVNGKVVTIPVFFIDDSHKITANGKPIGNKSEKLVENEVKKLMKAADHFEI